MEHLLLGDQQDHRPPALDGRELVGGEALVE
jgi:hypothetical protein